MIGIDRNWMRDASVGALYGLGFIAVNKLYPNFIIGVPHEIFGGYFFTTSVLAPILEEVGFRGVIYPTLKSRNGATAAIILSSVAFSLFHWAAYGLALTTAFLGAFAFGAMACVVADRDHSLAGPIVMHSIFNFWLTEGSKYVFVG